MFRMSSFVFLLDVSFETNKSDAGSRSLSVFLQCEIHPDLFQQDFCALVAFRVSFIHKCFIVLYLDPTTFVEAVISVSMCVSFVLCVFVCRSSTEKRFRLSNAPSVALTLKWALPASFQSSSTQIGPIKSRLLQSGSSSEQISLRLWAEVEGSNPAFSFLFLESEFIMVPTTATVGPPHCCGHRRAAQQVWRRVTAVRVSGSSSA